MAEVKRHHNVRMLVDQSSGLVVWLSYNIEVPPPIVNPTLNYYTFSSETSVELFPMYVDYKLYYNPQTRVFTVGETVAKNKELFPSVQLLRTKAVAVAHSIIISKTQYDRLDVSNKDFYFALSRATDLSSPWVPVYQAEYNCTPDEALKLIKFHFAEYETVVFTIESALLSVKNKIKSADTLDAVVAEYTTFCNKMIAAPWILKSLPMIKGPI